MDSQEDYELKLFKQWKKDQSKDSFQKLYKSMKPIIIKASRKGSYGSNLPESAKHIYASQAFYDSLKTFNPSMGKLKSHVYGSVEQKVKRLNYEFQNLGKIPEGRAQRIGLYQTVKENLKVKLGRQPTPREISNEAHIPINEVMRLQREVQEDFSTTTGENGADEFVFAEGPENEEVLNHLYYDLVGDEKIVYNYIFGKNGSPKLVRPDGGIDFKAIAQRIGGSEVKVRKITTKIKKKFIKAAK